MKRTLLIYLKNKKRPFIIEFESESKLNAFYTHLKMTDLQIVQIGPLTFSKEQFEYCIEV